MKTVTLLIAILLLGCNPETPQQKALKKHEKEKSTTKGYHDGSVYISKVRDCEYVFWHKEYGSDMEHYEGCTNPIHTKS